MKIKQTAHPEFCWLQQCSEDFWSCLIIFDEDEVKEKIRCAKLCKKPLDPFVKFKLTRV